MTLLVAVGVALLLYFVALAAVLWAYGERETTERPDPPERRV